MNAQERERLRKRMGEVAALSPEHPERQAVAGRVQAAGGEVEQEWLAMLQWDQRMRVELPQIPVPTALQENLLKIPVQHRRPRFPRLAVSLPVRWPMASIAALAALVLVVVGITLNFRARQSRALANFAALVAESHNETPGLSISSSDFQTVQDTLQKDLPFPIMPPHVDPKLRLMGGSVMTLNGRPVMYTRWDDHGRHYSLFQFCAKDFGIHEGLAKTSVTPGNVPGRRVVFWSQGTCDYALVTDEPGQSRPADQTAAAGLTPGAKEIPWD